MQFFMGEDFKLDGDDFSVDAVVELMDFLKGFSFVGVDVCFLVDFAFVCLCAGAGGWWCVLRTRLM
jgi:hypothetical protein